jgi:hypothetical protein
LGKNPEMIEEYKMSARESGTLKFKFSIRVNVVNCKYLAQILPKNGILLKKYSGLYINITKH